MFKKNSNISQAKKLTIVVTFLILSGLGDIIYSVFLKSQFFDLFKLLIFTSGESTVFYVFGWLLFLSVFSISIYFSWLLWISKSELFLIVRNLLNSRINYDIDSVV